MTDPTNPQPNLPPEPRWAPAPPVAAVAPGVVLLFAGLWMVTDGGPQPLGWGCFAFGLAFLLVGAVAQGVAWGMHLHVERQR